jgi:uncharacterized protein YkwD
MTLGVIVIALMGAIRPTPARADVTFDQKLLELMNQDRAANGVPALQSYAPMAGIAEDAPYAGCGYSVAGRAADMGQRDYFSHTILNCGGRQVFDVLSADNLSYTSAAENIGFESGVMDPAAAAQVLENQFMASPPHRANILNPNLTQVGVGSWRTAAGQSWSGTGPAYQNVYVTAVVFARLSSVPARPPSAPPSMTLVTGNGTLDASWPAAAPNGAAVDAYNVYLFDASGYIGRYLTVCGTCTRATIDGLTNGHAYLTAVIAHNAAGWSGPGYSGWATPGTPWAPPGVQVSVVGSGQATVSWGATKPGAIAIDVVVALIYDDAGYTGRYVVGCPICSSTTITGLTPGHRYYLAVLAHNLFGWGGVTVTARFTP